MTYVKAKKALGQHFLKDQNIARKIVGSLKIDGKSQVLEIGPGMGVLTQYLLENSDLDVNVIEIDRDSVVYLEEHFPALNNKIIEGDFLKMDISETFKGPYAIIGNFPYNISSQIFFNVLENRDLVPQVVGMIQKEVAERIAAPPGSKTYGILSVLLQAFYSIEYLFTVQPQVFAPTPKVKSAVIRLLRNEVKELGCDEKLFFNVVKTSFNQRRKTLHNSLKGLMRTSSNDPIFQSRPERLSVEDFVRLTNIIGSGQKGIKIPDLID